MNQDDVASLARRVLHAFDPGTPLSSFSAAYPGFDVAEAYEVLRDAERAASRDGWQPVGRKIGFTNRTIWPRYGIYRPMWAHVWAETVPRRRRHGLDFARARAVSRASSPKCLRTARPCRRPRCTARSSTAIEWIAPGFEIVQSHFPDWKFTSADCTAAFGLHRALVVGARIALTPMLRGRLCVGAPVFELTLRRGDST